MSDPRPPVTVAVSPRRGVRLLVSLLLLAAIGVAGVQAARWAKRTVEAVRSQQLLMARVEGDLAALRERAAKLESQQLKFSQAGEGTAETLEALGGRIDRAEQSVKGLAETVEGGRTRVQLAAIEQLLLMASDRLLLARDASGALRALEMADQRLASLRNPQLHRVREMLSQERATVAALVVPDTAGAAIALARLLAEAPKYPLRVQIPERFEAPPVPEPSATQGPFGRAATAVRTALTNIFALRRVDGAPPRLLSADEAALVGQILELKLEGARLALLAADGRSFRELVRAARAWLDAQYDLRDSRTQAAALELDRLAALDLAPSPPELGRTLALLRAQLGAPTP